ncbi:MAG: hypothetical protein AB7P23_00905 [Amphiplicatus sp.]
MAISSISSKRREVAARDIGRFLGALCDGFIFIGFLALSILALIAIAIAAPLALAVSAAAGAIAPQRQINHWRQAQAY